MRTIGGDDERLRRGTGRRRFPTILGSSAVPLPRLEIASTLYPRFLLDDASASLRRVGPSPSYATTTTRRRRTLEHERLPCKLFCSLAVLWSPGCRLVGAFLRFPEAGCRDKRAIRHLALPHRGCALTQQINVGIGRECRNFSGHLPGRISWGVVHRRVALFPLGNHPLQATRPRPTF